MQAAADSIPAWLSAYPYRLTQLRLCPLNSPHIPQSPPPTPANLGPPSLQVRAPRVEEISSVEASLRLDAVASAGFRMSRGKMADLIKAGGCRQV